MQRVVIAGDGGKGFHFPVGDQSGVGGFVTHGDFIECKIGDLHQRGSLNLCGDVAGG
jgi:hypothetical protein